MCCFIFLSLINKIARYRTFPAEWKHAVVSMIPKTASASDVAYFRPISLLSCVSKIAEHYFVTVFRNRLLQVISHSQFGFMRGRGTSDALYHVISKCCDLLNNSSAIAVVSLDISKAFDTVVHNKLLDILVHHIYQIVS